MGKYEVTKQCYVPGHKFKKPGQVVTLDDDVAAGLSDYLTPVSEDEGVAKRNRPKSKKVEAETVEAEPPTDTPEVQPEEVEPDAGEPSSAVQRTAVEALE